MSLKTKALIRRSLWTASARVTRYDASPHGAQGSWHKSLYRPAIAHSPRSSLLVELTREGRDLVAAAGPTTLANKRRLLSSLTAQEQSTLGVLLRKLLLGLEQAERNRAPEGLAPAAMRRGPPRG